MSDEPDRPRQAGAYGARQQSTATLSHAAAEALRCDDRIAYAAATLRCRRRSTRRPPSRPSARAALEVWHPASDRESWPACHEGIGWLLARQAPLTPAQQQEAIEHLECALGERPYLAAILAPLYQFHTLGDPWANWQKRVAYLEQDAALIERDSEPERWAKVTNALAVACQEEPDADFGAALERRLARPAQVLAALPAAATGARVDTWLALSECCRFRCLGDAAANLATAEGYARDALAACRPAAGWRLRAEALLALALLHRAERVGAIDGTPFTIDGLETIDAAAVDTSVLGLALGHGYFADQRSLLTDIGILVGAGLPAAQRALAQADRPRHSNFPR